MASISFSKDNGWVAAAWVMYYFLEHALPLLEPDTELRRRVENTVREEVQFLDLVGVSDTEKECLLRALVKALANLRGNGPSSMSVPEAYSGLVSRGEELIEELRRSLRQP